MKGKEICAKEIFDLLAIIDPKFDFGLTDIADFERLLSKMGVDLEPD